MAAKLLFFKNINKRMNFPHVGRWLGTWNRARFEHTSRLPQRGNTEPLRRAAVWQRSGATLRCTGRCSASPRYQQHFRTRKRLGAAFAPGSGPEVPAPRHFRGRQFECMYTAAQSSWSLRINPRIRGSNDDHGQQMLTLESPSGRGALFGAFCAGP